MSQISFDRLGTLLLPFFFPFFPLVKSISLRCAHHHVREVSLDHGEKSVCQHSLFSPGYGNVNEKHHQNMYTRGEAE